MAGVGSYAVADWSKPAAHELPEAQVWDWAQLAVRVLKVCDASDVVRSLAKALLAEREGESEGARKGRK